MIASKDGRSLPTGATTATMGRKRMLGGYAETVASEYVKLRCYLDASGLILPKNQRMYAKIHHGCAVDQIRPTMGNCWVD